MKLAGKTAVVTGGSRGIGRAICQELAQQGANIVLCYAGNEAAAQQAAEACRQFGVQALAIRCNVADADDVQHLINQTVDTFGRIDILVNNAGVTRDGLLMTMKETDYDSVLDTNLKGTFLCMKAVARGMVRQRQGRIINISSVVGLHGNAGQSNYAASKAGIIGLTKAAAKELAHKGITVNAVAPGFITTDMTAGLPEGTKERLMTSIPAGRLGMPEEVAKAVAFLADDDAAYITGQVLAVDGGMSM